MDNTSNNDTFVVSLEAELEACDVPFDHIECHIRFVIEFALLNRCSSI